MAVFDTSGDYTQAVIEVVAEIPPGHVMTYGDVAWTFGRPGARAVGMVMRFHGSGVPWWRVVRADGSLPESHQREAVARYRAESTPLRGSVTDAVTLRVDLAKAVWYP